VGVGTFAIKRESLKLNLPNHVTIDGDLNLIEPLELCRGLVIFAHGSGSSRLSVRNKFVASELNKSHIATLLVDLLTREEEVLDSRTRELRFNIPFLTQRLYDVSQWLMKHHSILYEHHIPIGYFGASTGGAAAIMTAIRAAEKPESDQLKLNVQAVVSRGGRPDLVPTQELHSLSIPTLLLVGGNDHDVIRMNESASIK